MPLHDSILLMETQSGIDEKTYRAIVAVVDRRMREIRVTRKDFDALKWAVTELAQAQKRTEQRLDSLAQKVEELAEAQRRTEERVEELAAAQKRTEQRVEELAQAQKRTEERVEELGENLRLLAAETRNLARQVGSLADNIGFGLEDIAHVVLPGYLYRHLGVEMGEFERRFVPVDGEEVEINLYAEGTMKGEKVTILGEVKSRIYAREVDTFQNTLSKVLPKIEGKVLKVMFGYFFRPEASELARNYDIIPVVSYQR